MASGGRSGPTTALHGGRAFALAILIYGIVVSGVTLPTPLYVTYQDRWDLSNASVTLLYSMYPVGVLVVLLLAGHWSDSVGRKAVLAVAITASALSSLCFLIAANFALLAIARTLTGVASGLVVSAANALLVELYPVDRRRHASLVSAGTNQLGLGAGALASAFLVEYAWEPTRTVFACHLAALAVGSACLRYVPETVMHRRRFTLRVQRLRLPESERSRFLAASLAAFAAFALCGLLAALAPAILRDQLGSDSPVFAGGAVFLIFAASGVSQIGWFRLRDVTALVSGLMLLVGSLGLITLGLATTSVALFLAGITAGGVAVGAVFMSSLAMVNAGASRERRSQATSTYFAITFSGLILPVVGTGLAADHLTQFQATTAFASVIGAVAAAAAISICAVNVRDKRRAVDVRSRTGAPQSEPG